MTILLYACTLLATVAQSACTKQYHRVATGAALFNICKAAAACLLFALLCITSFTFHLPTLWYGLLYGCLMCLSMYAGFIALGLGPMSLTSLIVSFSVLLPLLYGLFFCNEEFGLLKICGLAALVVALVCANLGKKNGDQKETNYPKWLFYTMLTFLSNGMASILQKQHQIDYTGLYITEFLLYAMLVCVLVFGVAALCRLRPRECFAPHRGKRYGLLAGVCSGLVNYGTLALSGMENASVLFPALSAGTILLSLLCGTLLFGERLRWPHYLALAAGTAAIVLLKL